MRHTTLCSSAALLVAAVCRSPAHAQPPAANAGMLAGCDGARARDTASAMSLASCKVGFDEDSTVRRELQSRYDANSRAFLANDFDAIMALRTEDFHSVTPDGARHDRVEMEQSTRALLDGIDRWLALTFDIDSLDVSGDTAHAVVRQHADRMARRSDGRVHHVETWVTQRESWQRSSSGWRLYRVDSLRAQRRLVDGTPG